LNQETSLMFCSNQATELQCLLNKVKNEYCKKLGRSSWNCLYAFWQDEYQIIMMMNSYSHCFYEFHIGSFLILLFELILSKKLIHDATTRGMMLNTTEWFLLSTFPILSKKLIHDATTRGMMLNTTEWFLLSTFPVYHSPSFLKFLILVYLIARPEPLDLIIDYRCM